jgi:AhpD family alkylhydroperoxidase
MDLQPRMKNPAYFVPGAMNALQSLGSSWKDLGVPEATLELVHLRASQINGCAWCLDYGTKNAIKAGETPLRLATVAAWREAPFFTEAERAALALAESMTRLADSPDPVPDAVWDEAQKHYGEQEISALIMCIATTNLYNRLNVTTQQVAGRW